MQALTNSHQIINKPTRKTARCTSCANVLRLWFEGPLTIALEQAQFKYCPLCGKPTLLVSIDLDADYWEVLGSHYGYPSYIIKAIYDSWDTKTYIKFSDYVEALREEVAASSTTLAQEG